MHAKLSASGEVVLPARIRRKLGLKCGDSLDIKIVEDHIALIPKKKDSRRSRIMTDAVTGWPVLVTHAREPKLRHKQVHKLLANFP